MKFEKITITSDDIDVIEDALACAEQSWRDLLTENPEACDEDDVNLEIVKIRHVSSFISIIQENSPITVEVES